MSVAQESLESSRALPVGVDPEELLRRMMSCCGFDGLCPKRNRSLSLMMVKRRRKLRRMMGKRQTKKGAESA